MARGKEKEPSETEEGGKAEKRDSPLFVRSVEKALGLLSTFDVSHRRQSLSQLAERAQTDLSTAQRFAYTLERLGLLRKDKATRLYELAPKMMNFGFRYLQGNDVIERAMPMMLHLSKTTEAAVNLMVQDDTDIVYIHRLHSRHLINPEIMVGARLPMFATASGLAMMANMPGDEVDGILARSTLREYTSFTQTDRGVIRARLETIREKGYAVAYQETYLGDISIAAAILDNRGGAVAALAISTSTLVTTLQDVEENYSSLVAAAAANLSQRYPINV
jgi:DNA-binding IclR family transcriptional regulator